jgi:hypothetical protein
MEQLCHQISSPKFICSPRKKTNLVELLLTGLIANGASLQPKLDMLLLMVRFFFFCIQIYILKLDLIFLHDLYTLYPFQHFVTWLICVVTIPIYYFYAKTLTSRVISKFYFLGVNHIFSTCAFTISTRYHSLYLGQRDH